jgi:hypothetical protein
MKVKFKEIIELADYCDEIGVEIKYSMWFGGYVLYFNNEGICAQHYEIKGAENGFVVFDYHDHEIDDKPVTLEEAKKFVKENKEFLNKVFE